MAAGSCRSEGGAASPGNDVINIHAAPIVAVPHGRIM
jgi:hypothetical protein